MCAILNSLWVRKLTGKPAFLTIADSESEAPRIQLTEHEIYLPVPAAESKAFRNQSDLDWPDSPGPRRGTGVLIRHRGQVRGCSNFLSRTA